MNARRRRTAQIVIVAVLAVAGLAGRGVPRAAADANCTDFATQSAAQNYYIAHGGRAQGPDGLDADHDGIACESLPCPCLKPGGDGGGGADPSPTPTPTPDPKSSCQKPSAVQSIAFSKSKYPDIRKHALAAIRAGWPAVLVINRPGADARRDRLLEHAPTRDGYDRDEYPPAVGRGRGKGLVRGSHPRGWKADVAYVPSAQNRSHGSSLGAKLRHFCDGTRFRYVVR